MTTQRDRKVDDYCRAGASKALARLLADEDPLAQGEWEVLQALRTEAITKPSTAALQWYLEHVYPERYGNRTKDAVEDEMQRVCDAIEAEAGQDVLRAVLRRVTGDPL